MASLTGIGDGPEHGTGDRPPCSGHGAHEGGHSRRSRTPAESFLRWNPVVALSAGVVVILALVLSAAYPSPAQETSDTAMAGMTGMTGNSGSSDPTVATASCSAGNNGVARSGLDVNNTPYMIMSGTQGMNMNGADASAAAGLNTTKANWSYTGPALPTALANELLTQGKNGPDQIHMAVSGCAAEPTFSQQIKATQYVQQTSQAVAKYADVSAAVAAGYVPVSPTDYPVVYYVNPSIAAANAAAEADTEPGQYRWSGLCADSVGWRGARSGLLRVAIDTAQATDAVWCPGAMASTHGRLWARVGPGDDTGHHGNPTVPFRHGPEADAIHDNGVAGPRGRRPDGHSASRYSNCRSGHHGVNDLIDLRRKPLDSANRSCWESSSLETPDASWHLCGPHGETHRVLIWERELRWQTIGEIFPSPQVPPKC